MSQMELCECDGCVEARKEEDERLYQQFKRRLLAELQDDFNRNGSIRRLIRDAVPSHYHDHQ